MFKYIEVLFRYWFRFALLCVGLPLVAGTAALYVFQGKDGSAQLWVDNPSYIGNIQTASGWNQWLTPSQNTVDSLDQLIQTDDFYQRLGQALLQNGTVSSQSDANQIASEAKSSLSATATGSHLVTIRVECRVPAVCIQVLNTTISLHRDWLIQTERQQADVASTFYNAQLKVAKASLQTRIDAFNAYVTNHPIPANTLRPPDPDYDRLQSDVQQEQAKVNDLQDRISTIQFSYDAAAEIDRTALRVIDQPGVSGGRFTTVTKKMALTFGGAAAVPGIAYLLFLGWIDRTTRNPKEIEGRIGVRVVSMIGNLATKAA
jgi:hypothetical protein